MNYHIKQFWRKMRWSTDQPTRQNCAVTIVSEHELDSETHIRGCWYHSIYLLFPMTRWHLFPRSKTIVLVISSCFKTWFERVPGVMSPLIHMADSSLVRCEHALFRMNKEERETRTHNLKNLLWKNCKNKFLPTAGGAL